MSIQVIGDVCLTDLFVFCLFVCFFLFFFASSRQLSRRACPLKNIMVFDRERCTSKILTFKTRVILRHENLASHAIDYCR